MIRHPRDVSLIAREVSLIALFRIPLTKDDQLIDPDSPGITIPDLILPSVTASPVMAGPCVRINDDPPTDRPATLPVRMARGAPGGVPNPVADSSRKFTILREADPRSP